MLFFRNFIEENNNNVVVRILMIVWTFWLLVSSIYTNANSAVSSSSDFLFLGKRITINNSNWSTITYNEPLQANAINKWYQAVNEGYYQPVVDSLLSFKKTYQLNDWLFYQLIRRTAQEMSPKQSNYNQYTLYKWFLLNKSGYAARLAINDTQLFFYVSSNDEVFDIPFYKVDGQRFVCLNFHDFGLKDMNGIVPNEVPTVIPEGQQLFSYKIEQMPDFGNNSYTEKSLQFHYKNQPQHFNFKVNEQVAVLFKNYPVVDFEQYFNIPLSAETYNSLLPELKAAVKDMDIRSGVDYLMRFTRHAFAYKNDIQAFGKEKRFSPELTLLNDFSDCDDRAALFFMLVKEIYNLPMIVLLYPEHLTIAVHFEKANGKPIKYKNKKYYICEPTPQARDLAIGEQQPELRKAQYHIAYEYNP